MYAGVGDDNFFRVNLNWFITNVSGLSSQPLQSEHPCWPPRRRSKSSDIFFGQRSSRHVTGGAIYALAHLCQLQMGQSHSQHCYREIRIIPSENIVRSDQQASIRHPAWCMSCSWPHLPRQPQILLIIIFIIKSYKEDHPEPGEAAGYALGMVMLGSGSQETIDEMIRICENTEHEKIMRGIAMGLDLSSTDAAPEQTTLSSECSTAGSLSCAKELHGSSHSQT
ncbi:regulation of protein catabolic process [Trichomonas vaginalis G3]|uniref:regulation of protein catabolic process n=1 Tax=Trichomonas vaginalis (strain ATCC PRA-98 / G3) TaxID=412133 RepID=UPI0021E59264|nr:regulation of protein catabolic process [Trichomonas vaginalis G3]KAI5542351.1 regulation of protein catabolic process [Trichomonas vaginalis G3]